MEKPITEKRLDSLYTYVNNNHSRWQKEVLNYLLATIPHSLVKQTVEHFDIKIE